MLGTQIQLQYQYNPLSVTMKLLLLLLLSLWGRNLFYALKFLVPLFELPKVYRECWVVLVSVQGRYGGCGDSLGIHELSLTSYTWRSSIILMRLFPFD